MQFKSAPVVSTAAARRCSRPRFRAGARRSARWSGWAIAIESLHEFDFVEYHALPFMKQGDDGRWRLPSHRESVPLQYSIRARKPELGGSAPGTLPAAGVR